MRVAFGLAMLAVVACDGNGSSDSGDSGYEPPPVDTSPEFPWFEASQIYLNAEIAYDGARPITADVDGNAIPPMIYFTLATDGWDGTSADVENYCLIGIPLVDPDERPERLFEQSTYRSMYFAYGWNRDRDPVLSTCNTEGYEFDPEMWGNDPVGLFTNDVDHFIAIGPLTEETQRIIQQQAPDLDLVGGTIGVPGFFGNSGGAPGQINLVYAFAYATDSSGRLLVESGGLVERTGTDIAGDNQQPAFYSMSSLVYWQL